MKTRTKSKQLFSDSCEVIPGGVNSPVRAFSGLGISPLMVYKGCGDLVTDLDQHQYIDYCMSWGALILGHAPKEVVEASIRQMSEGSSFGIATPSEQKLAQEIVFLIPSIDKVRFFSSGTEAVMTAARVARGFTDRSLILKFNGNYHGHSDGFLIKAGSSVATLNPESSSKGVPLDVVKHTISLPYNDLEACRDFFKKHSGELAGVILEPIAANMGVVPATQEFLELLREETKKSGALLIFDEVITGFRVGLQGAQGLYGIEPDLTCFGKVIGGGFPAAAIGGKKEIMDHLAPLGEVYQAGTLSGNPVAMEAGYATLKELQKPQFYETLEKKTRLITDPLKEYIRDNDLPLTLHQVGSLFTLFFGLKEVHNREDLEKLDHEAFRQFFSSLFDAGIYFSPSQFEACFVSSAHTEEHLLQTRDKILECLK